MVYEDRDATKCNYAITTVNGDSYFYETTIKGAKYVIEDLLENKSDYIEVINNEKKETVIKTEYIVSITKLKGWR